MASALPFDLKLETAACGGAFSEDAINGVCRPGTSRQGPGIIIRVSRLVHTIIHITYTAANRETERDMYGTRG